MSASEIFLPAMDRSDHHFQSLSFCNKLYNFVMKTLLAYALKPVILGHPLRPKESKAQNGTANKTDQMLHSQNQSSSEGKQEAEIIAISSMIENNVNGDVKDGEDEAEMASVVSEKKAPKKVVSINEIVEEIPTSKTKLRRKKSTDKLNSFEFQEDEIVKPLKSILKVGSNLGDNLFIMKSQVHPHF